MIGIREKCFVETLDEVTTTVDMIINRIDGLYNETEIDEKYIKDDIKKAFCDLEINLALLAIIIRKMQENDYISIDGQLRYDLNALIHSSRFSYRNHALYASSDRGEEFLDIQNIMDFARTIIKNKV